MASKNYKSAAILMVLGLTASILVLAGCTLVSNPHAQFTADPAFGYPPLVVHFDASNSISQDGAIISYSWDFDDGTTDRGSTVYHTFYNKGSYDVTLTVVDSAGAVGEISHTVEALNRAPTAQFTVFPHIPQRKTQTQFDASQSDDQDGYITDWQWSFGDGTSKTGEVVSHNYELAGTYDVHLTVIDNDGKAGELIKKVIIGGCNTCQ